MKITRWFLCVAPAVLAATAPPAVKVERAPVVYHAAASSVRRIDFANFSYDVGGERMRLRKGRYVHNDEMSSETLELRKVWYFSTAGASQRAIVSLLHYGAAGSSYEETVVFVFEVNAGHPVAVGRFVYDSQAPGTGVVFDPAETKLILKARARDDSPHCCPEHLEIATYTWTPTGFACSGRRLVPVPEHKAR